MPNRPLDDYTPEDWKRAGEAVSTRMGQLGLSQTDLERRADVSAGTIRPLRNGEPGVRRDATLSKLAQALEWPHNAIRRVLAGHDPSEFETTIVLNDRNGRDDNGDPPAPAPPQRSYDERIAALPAAARRMIDSVIDTAEREIHPSNDMPNGGGWRTLAMM